VASYVGDPGVPFREAVACHFQVSRRTVESELPRAVRKGVLLVTELQTRGNPKTYAVTPEHQRRLAEGGYQKMADLVNSGDLPRVQPAFFKALEAAGLSYELGLSCFTLGLLAFCPICGSVRQLSPGRLIQPPICSDHSSQLAEESGEWVPREMISAWSMGLLLVDAECESTSPPRRSMPESDFGYRYD
jgi:hypothetical protein